MIGINKRSSYVEECWEMAKALYVSRDIAENTFRENMSVSPVKAFWSEPFYHEPAPFYRGQAPGTLLVEAAPYVPCRPSSPYAFTAYAHLTTTHMTLRAYADKHEVYDAAALAPVALRLLEKAQADLVKLISRNVFAEDENAEH